MSFGEERERNKMPCQVRAELVDTAPVGGEECHSSKYQAPTGTKYFDILAWTLLLHKHALCNTCLFVSLSLCTSSQRNFFSPDITCLHCNLSVNSPASMTWREPRTGDPKRRALLTSSGRVWSLQVKGKLIKRDKMGQDRIKFGNQFGFYYFVNRLALRLYTTHIFTEFDPNAT